MPQPPNGPDNDTRATGSHDPPPRSKGVNWAAVTAIAGTLVALVALVTYLKSCGDDEPPAATSSSAPRTTPSKTPKDLRLLLAIDTSGSMSWKLAESNQRRIDAAVTNVLVALHSGEIKDPYELGLWTFRGPRYRERLAIAPYEGTRKDRIDRELRRLRRRQRNDGGTPLYGTIREGLDELKSQADRDDTDDTVNVMVILTDSKDNPGDDADQVDAAEVNGLLKREKRIPILITAAYDSSCTDLEKVLTALRQPPHRCVQVDGAGNLDKALDEMIKRLAAARQR